MSERITLYRVEAKRPNIEPPEWVPVKGWTTESEARRFALDFGKPMTEEHRRSLHYPEIKCRIISGRFERIDHDV